MQAKLMVVPLVAVLLTACGGEREKSSFAARSVPAARSDQVEVAGPESVQVPVSVLRDSASADTPVRSQEGANLLRPMFETCVSNAAGVTADTQACIEIEFVFHKRRLDAALESHRRALDEAGRQWLVREQARWEVQRDSRCAWDADEQGQAQRLEANLCLLEETAQRASELESAREAGQN